MKSQRIRAIQEDIFLAEQDFALQHPVVVEELIQQYKNNYTFILLKATPGKLGSGLQFAAETLATHILNVAKIQINCSKLLVGLPSALDYLTQHMISPSSNPKEADHKRKESEAEAKKKELIRIGGKISVALQHHQFEKAATYLERIKKIVRKYFLIQAVPNFTKEFPLVADHIFTKHPSTDFVDFIRLRLNEMSVKAKDQSRSEYIFPYTQYYSLVKKNKNAILMALIDEAEKEVNVGTNLEEYAELIFEHVTLLKDTTPADQINTVVERILNYITAKQNGEMAVFDIPFDIDVVELSKFVPMPDIGFSVKGDQKVAKMEQKIPVFETADKAFTFAFHKAQILTNELNEYRNNKQVQQSDVPHIEAGFAAGRRAAILAAEKEAAAKQRISSGDRGDYKQETKRDNTAIQKEAVAAWREYNGLKKPTRPKTAGIFQEPQSASAATAASSPADKYALPGQVTPEESAENPNERGSSLRRKSAS